MDNNPSSPEGVTTREFLKWVPNARYLTFTGWKGTAKPRDLVFEHASGDWVMVLDPHVLLAPGSMGRLLDYCGENPDSRDLLSGPLIYDDHKGYSTHFDDAWRAEMWGTWGTDERGGDPDGPPFEIGANGLGLFAMRKGAWVGFNDSFRGFGGEEWYVHTKVRQRGGKCLCLPFLRWNHRFGRPGGVPYPLTRYQKARNYYLGLTELGLPTDPVYEHFVKSGLLTEDHWKGITGGRAEENPVSPPPPKKPGCGGCGGVTHHGPPNRPDSLDDWFLRASSAPTHLDQHVPRIRELAAGCTHVTELGGERSVSTVALLSARPKALRIIDPREWAEDGWLRELAGGTEVVFDRKKSQDAAREETDFLFIDTEHTAPQVYRELTLHAPGSGRVVLHDTVLYGENGQDNGPGLLPGVRRFLSERPEWAVLESHDHQYGLLVLSNREEDRKPLPSKLEMAWNFAKAQAQHLLSGGGYLTEDEAQERLRHCWVCDKRNGGRCSACGCHLDSFPDGSPGKAFYPSQACPLGKWHAREKK